MSCEVFNETDFGMIEGSQQTINLNIFNILGESFSSVAINSVTWRMSVYGETECVVEKDSITNSRDFEIDENSIQITILSSETEGLHGKFTHQIVITDLHGSNFIVDLGRISIKPRIK